MTGLIWLVQIVHYPSFRFIDELQFTSFQEFHMRRISYIVLPIMLLELGTAGILVFNNPNRLFVLNLTIVVLIWASTFFLSMSAHQNLVEGKSLEIINKLVITNWPRTVLWSIRSILLGWMVYENIQS